MIIFLASYTDLAIEASFHIAEKGSGPLKDNIAITQSKKAGLARLEFQNPLLNPLNLCVPILLGRMVLCPLDSRLVLLQLWILPSFNKDVLSLIKRSPCLEAIRIIHTASDDLKHTSLEDQD